MSDGIQFNNKSSLKPLYELQIEFLDMVAMQSLQSTCSGCHGNAVFVCVSVHIVPVHKLMSLDTLYKI